MGGEEGDEPAEVEVRREAAKEEEEEEGGEKAPPCPFEVERKEEEAEGMVGRLMGWLTPRVWVEEEGSELVDCSAGVMAALQGWRGYQ